jgi:hypothetical protein
MVLATMRRINAMLTLYIPLVKDATGEETSGEVDVEKTGDRLTGAKGRNRAKRLERCDGFRPSYLRRINFSGDDPYDGR